MSSEPLLYLDIHNHGVRRPACVTSLTPGELRSGLDRGPGYITVGLHPWELSEEELEKEFAGVEAALALEDVIGVGECGIDRRKGTLSVSRQREIFGLHVELAESRNLPVIIHAVKSLADIYSLRRSHQKTPWIIHAFFGNEEEIRQCRRHDIRISPGIAILHMMGQAEEHKLLRLLPTIDPELLYLETDGVRVSIREIHSIAARWLGTEPEELARQLHRNFRRDFGRDPQQ